MEPSTRPRPWRTSRPELHSQAFEGKFWRKERTFILLGSLFVGIFGGATALIFRSLIDSSFLSFGWLSGLDSGIRTLAFLGVPALGGLLVGLLSRRRLGRAATHGMGGIRMAFITTGGSLSVRSALWRALGCALTTVSGGSAGCEGPTAHVGGALGSFFARRLNLHPSAKQELIACGVSASLAGLFHTPIAAVVFATEVILGGYAIRSFVPLVLSAVSAMALTRHVGGKGPALDIPWFVLSNPVDLFAYLLLGLSCGLLAALFLHLLDRIQTLRLRIPRVLQPAFGGLFIGAIALLIPGVLGVGYPVIDTVFRGQLALSMVGVLLVAKVFATLLTLGFRGIGGVFAPSLLVGSALGWLVGHGLHSLDDFNRTVHLSFAPPSSFASAGMIAMVAGVTHAPFTAAVFLLETTRSYQAILPGIIAAMAASMLSTALHKDSAYSTNQEDKGKKERSASHTTSLSSATIENLIDAVQDTVPATMPARELLRRLPMVRTPILVVTQEKAVIGVIATHQAARLDKNQFAEASVLALMIETGVLTTETSVTQAVLMFMEHDELAMPVTDSLGNLVGLVWRSDLMDFCAHELLLEHDPFHRFTSLPPPSVEETQGKTTSPVHHQVTALPVPRSIVGRPLREVDLGKRYGVVCVGLRRVTETGDFVAVALSPSLILRHDDILIVTGNLEDLQGLDELVEYEGRGAKRS